MAVTELLLTSAAMWKRTWSLVMAGGLAVGCKGSLPDEPITPEDDGGLVADLGSPPEDGGQTPVDTGVEVPDSGSEMPDSGEAPRDTGPRPDTGVVTGPGTRSPWRMGTRYIQSGHSLTDVVMSHPWPGRLTRAVMMDSEGSFADIGKATIPGSFIHWRWRNSEGGGDQGAEWPEQMPNYEGLVITTAVPLYADDATRQSEQVEWVRRAAVDAWENGNGGRGAPMLLYTTWTQLVADPNEPHPEDGLPFRQRLDRDEARWEAMMDFANEVRPEGQPAVHIIPGHRLMMRIYDDIQAGNAPFERIEQLFGDTIHPNGVGSYAVTLLHYACIYGRDPAAWLPDRLVDEDTLTAQQAAYFKRVVREVVTSYPRSGLTQLSGR